MVYEKTIESLVEAEVKPYKEYVEKALKQSQYDVYLNTIAQIKAAEQEVVKEIRTIYKQCEGLPSNSNLLERAKKSAIDRFHIQCRAYMNTNNLFQNYIKKLNNEITK